MNASSKCLDLVQPSSAMAGAGRWGLGVALVLLLAAAPPATATKVMPVGNSITAGDGSTSGLGFRDLLHTQLNTIGTYAFVGSSGAAPYQGHFVGGATVEEFYPGSFGAGHGSGTFDVTADMNTNQPDVVLVHLGTNDVNSSQAPYAPYSTDHGTTISNTASGELGDLVKYLLQWHDGTNGTSVAQIVISRIIPIQNRSADVATFNREVMRMVLDFRNGAVTGSPEPVYLADHYVPFAANPDLFSGGAGDWMNDVLHPNDTGYGQMADVYFTSVDQVLNDPGPPDAVTDLQLGTVSGSSALVIWTNTGDSGLTGNPWYADVRYSTTSIDANNFKNKNQAGDYQRVGNGGTVAGVRVTGLNTGSNYSFAMKLMDDASNLSPMSNVVASSTLNDADTYADSFNRTLLGPDWSADPDFSVNGSELVNGGAVGGAEFVAIFTGAMNPTTAQFNWAASADQGGIDNAGFACRMDGTDPATANGYIVFRNVEAGQGCTLFAIENGIVVPPSIETAAPVQPAPVPGDEFRVLLSSDTNGHHFSVYINGALDAVLTDPNKLWGNGDYYAGYIGSGGQNDNIDNFQVQTVTSNLPPGPFTLLQPGNGVLLANLNPVFEWEQAIDPNPGDAVTYRLLYSTDPAFPPASTTTVSGLLGTSYGAGALLPANATFYWKVVAEDPFGLQVTSTDTFSFDTDNVQQLGDDFERATLGSNWNADPGFFIENGQLACSTPSFDDIAVYNQTSTVRGVKWTFSSTTNQADLDAAGCVFLDGASQDSHGYFIFRKTSGSEKWSVWEIQNGLLVGSLNIDTSGLLLPPTPGTQMRVNFTQTPSGNVFECYMNDEYDARLIDTSMAQVNGPDVYGGMILGQNAANNIEDFAVLAFDANFPPLPFHLLSPGDGSILFSLAPTLSWEAAVDPNPGDIITYTVQWDLDPAFGNPQILPPTGNTSAPFTGELFSGVPYYWRVQARDAGGAVVWSPDTWSFQLAQNLSVADDFNRVDLGASWAADATMQIVNNELGNTATGGGTDFAVHRDVNNPDAVQFDWGTSANNDGIRRGGIAVMLDAPSSSPNGYWVRIDPVTHEMVLEHIVNGAAGSILSTVPKSGPAADPGSGDEFRVVISTDQNGHHFDCYINRVLYGRVSDPNKIEGNGSMLYAGIALRGNQQNNVDNFLATAIIFGPPPQAFALLSPPHMGVDVPAANTQFSWEAASGDGTVYTVYVNTDSTFTGADSSQVQTVTSYTRPDTLNGFTDYFWRMRATDGNVSVFNTNGWHQFTTGDANPVELSRFEASGEVQRVVLHWAASAEIDHLGYHVWRSEEAASGYVRLTEQLIRGTGPYTFADQTVVRGRTYYYELEAVDRFGGSEFHGPVQGRTAGVPRRMALHTNVPNPFNPSTRIGFELNTDTEVRLVIFDVTGRTIRHLAAGRYEAGVHDLLWDGRNDQGAAAGSGAYFYRLEAGDWSQTRKMLLIR